MKSVGLGCVLVLLAGSARAEAPSGDEAVKQAMRDEMTRTMEKLRIEGEARPHHVVYTITDHEDGFAQANFGASTASNQRRRRSVRVELRVGDESYDSGNYFDPATYYLFEQSPGTLPIEDDYLALRRELWLRTDEAFKRALEALSRKRAAEKARAGGEQDAKIDFAKAAPAETVATHPGYETPLDLAALGKTTRALSAVFREFPALQSSLVTARHYRARVRLATSAGSWKDERKSVAEIFVSAQAQADDGMFVRSWLPIASSSPAGLPPLPEMEKAVREMAGQVTAARAAPIPEAGNAVVLFEPRAAGQVLRRMLGDQLSGTPPPMTSGSGSGDGPVRASELSTRLGQRIGPAFLDVYDDPRGDFGPGKIPLFGAYRADDEGVPAARVDLIANGVLKSLLMSRTPRKQILTSNGHGRGAAVAGAVRGDVGVLYVSGGSAGLPDAALRARAVKEARAAGPGTAIYIVRHVAGGGAADGDEGAGSSAARRAGSFRPLVVSRLVDGKEEPVRGISFANLQPRALKDIVAMGKNQVVYNYLERTAGDGNLDGSIVAPAVVFRDVEVVRSADKLPRPAIYPHPFFSQK